MKTEKTSLIRKDSFQTILASLACILGGLIVGYLVLLLIEPSGAFNAIVAVMKSFFRYPGTLKLKTPGVYTATQTPISGTKVVESFYVRLPASESNTAAVVDVLDNPYFMEAGMDDIQDLLVYFAMALVILLFVEWWLQSRKQF